MTSIDAECLLRGMGRCHVLLVGDLMLDEYLWGEIDRISPEAPVPAMHLPPLGAVPRRAANVERNLASLGARVSAIGVVVTDCGAGASLRWRSRRGRRGVMPLIWPTPLRAWSCASGVLAS